MTLRGWRLDCGWVPLHPTDWPAYDLEAEAEMAASIARGGRNHYREADDECGGKMHLRIARPLPYSYCCRCRYQGWKLNISLVSKTNQYSSHCRITAFTLPHW
jgi:hypothetical protein